MSDPRSFQVYSDEELARIEGWCRDDEPVVPTGVAGLRRLASGAALGAMMVRLGEILEGRPVGDDVAIVREDPGEPDDPDAPVLLDFDPESPAATTAVVRRPQG